MDVDFEKVVEFEIIKPLSFSEKMNDPIKKNEWGKFESSTGREYNLQEMMAYPERFKPTTIFDGGKEVKL